MLNVVNIQKENKILSKQKIEYKENFNNEKLVVDYKDYYFSNVVARSSKTMIDCHNSKIKIKKTGTDG